jgi:hypothetical protein
MGDPRVARAEGSCLGRVVVLEVVVVVVVTVAVVR